MGIFYEMNCESCGHIFNFYNGFGFEGGFLYCNRCGEHKIVRLDGYLKNLRDDERLTDKIESGIEICKCGGSFRFDSPPSCPKCSSFDLNEQSVAGLWD